MKYLVFTFLFAVSTCYALKGEAQFQAEFINFMHLFGKSYAHDEFHDKYSVYKANSDLIDNYNEKNTGVTLKMNHFGDLTSEEFKAFYTGTKVDSSKPKNYGRMATRRSNLPDSVDWRAKGAVTSPKDQAQCGSCWSFSSTGALEGLHFLHNSTLLSFSEQQLVDCSSSYGNEGCNGGLMDNAFMYTASQGIELESSYPYTAKDGVCKYSESKVVFKNAGYEDVTENDPTALMTAIAQQPVSVAVEADQAAWQFYSSGVVTASHCGTDLDHGVLAVGYGSQNGKDMYIIKNSWGPNWGDHGYILLERTTAKGPGTCGIQMAASYPTL